MPTTTTKKKTKAKTKSTKAGEKKAKAPAARMALAEAVCALEKAGSEQTRKTYLRQGATEPMFGVSFGTLGTLMRRIGVDHELALALWDTGNFDAQNLAAKICDPAKMTSAGLDKWARTYSPSRMSGGYVGIVAGEGPHAEAKVPQWLASKNEGERRAGWALLGNLAARSTTIADAWFEKHLREIERTIHAAPKAERHFMNVALIEIGCRSPALRKSALTAAKRIGKVDAVDDTASCQTPDAAGYIDKAWTYSKGRGFESPAALERTRASQRTRC
jgi:3-methyladenine DNA glycosylase AlkD